MTRIPSGAKAHSSLMALTARLESCPDASSNSEGSFRQSTTCPDGSCLNEAVVPIQGFEFLLHLRKMSAWPGCYEGRQA